MATLNVSGRTLQDEMLDYEPHLRRSVADTGISWERVAVYERPFGASFHEGWRAGTETTDLEGFESRFREILNQAHGGWVNLEPETISNGCLIIAIVWRPDGTGARGLHALPVSVMTSGFTYATVDHLQVTNAGRGGGARPDER